MDLLLRLTLFGSPEVSLEDQPLTGFISVKSKALLFYLAMKPGVHGRFTLATLLWPETPEAAAAKNLRNVLSNLRKLVGTHLDVTRQTVAFRRDAPYDLDVEAFSARLERYRRGGENIGDLETAVSLYTGDFLDGFYVPDSAAFEAWLTAEREQLRQAQLAALYTLAVWHAERADLDAGIDYISRLLTLDSLNESGQRLKMALLTQAGHRSQALSQYEAFCRQLAEELGAAPLAETSRLYEQIKSGAFAPDVWRQAIALAPGSYLPAAAAQQALKAKGDQTARTPPQQIDWGEMPGQFPIYGREAHLQQLEQWLRAGRVRLAAITGMGGVGKTALAASLVRRFVLPDAGGRPSAVYQHIIWRSLVNTPPLADILRDWLTNLSNHELVELPASESEQFALLLDYLRQRRCLLILDNFESLMPIGSLAGSFPGEYGRYERLLQLIGDTEHQSCLLLTSRELPKKLLQQQPDAGPVRHLALSGLPDEPGLDLLRAHGLAGDAERLVQLVQAYSGNPLALKLVADTAQTLFGGDTEMLLGETVVFGDIRDVLDEQFHNLTPLEDQLLAWLAVEREPVTAETLWRNLAAQPHKREYLEALRNLYFRSLLEQTTPANAAASGDTFHYTLQNVVMEYATSRLVEAICREITTGSVNRLQQVALLKAHTREYVHKSQRRMLLEPVAQWLAGRLGKAGAAAALRRLLAQVRAEPALLSGYAGANILQLLVALDADLHGLDFSGLAIRQADLRFVALRDVSFRGSDLTGTIFRDTFGLVVKVAFSPDGRLLAACATDGSLTFWRLYEYQPHLMIQRDSGFDFDIAFSPDGRYVAGGGNDRIIRLWDVQTGEEVRRFTAHTRQITAVAFHPDGSHLVSSSEDLTIAVWKAPDGQLVRQILTAEAIILALAVSPDGRILAGGGTDGLIYLWQTQSGELLCRLNSGGGKKIKALSFSPDGQVLAAGGEDHAIHVWRVEDGQPLAALRDHTNVVLSVAFHPDGRTLASGSADKTVRLWDWSAGQTRRVIPGGNNWVRSVAFSPDGATLAGGGYDRNIRLWQTASGELLHALRGTLRHVNEVAYSPDGRLLASASFDQPVRVWDAADGRLLHILSGLNGSVRRLAFSPDGRILALSGDSREVRLWQAATGKPLQKLFIDQPFARTLAFSPDGRFLAIGTGLQTGALLLVEAQTCQLRRNIPDVRSGLALSLSFSPDGRFLAYSDGDCALRLLDLDADAVCCTRAGHQALVGNIRFSPDGALLASQDAEGTLMLWQVSQAGVLTLRAQIAGYSAAADFWNLVFSPDGRLVAFQVDGAQVGILDTAGGQLCAVVAASLYAERCLAFSADSDAVLTVSEDGRLRLWDAATGDQRRTLQEGVLGSIDVNPQNGLVASGGDDGVIRIWNVDTAVCERTLIPAGPYEGLDISGAMGLSPAQVATLKTLGAVTSTGAGWL